MPFFLSKKKKKKKKEIVGVAMLALPDHCAIFSTYALQCLQ